MSDEREKEGLTLLGNQGVKYPTDYNPELLEAFENKHPDRTETKMYYGGRNIKRKFI